MKLKFIDLFAGIGGFHLAMSKLGHECVFASEIDKYARITYEENFKKKCPYIFKNNLFNKDILSTDYKKIPDFDVLCAGFPCQPFSQAGKKKGFSDDKDSRGNMFFAIRDIVKVKKPKVVLLENVRNLVNHDSGKTFIKIRDILEQELKYSFHYKIIRASDFGLPQHRPRVYIVCFKDEINLFSKFTFPKPIILKKTMSDIFGGSCNKDIGYTLRVGGKSSPINDRRNWDQYIVNGNVVKLSSTEGKKMMGFPKNFKFPVSEAQAMKQLGNSVAVNVVYNVILNIMVHLKETSNLN